MVGLMGVCYTCGGEIDPEEVTSTICDWCLLGLEKENMTLSKNSKCLGCKFCKFDVNWMIYRCFVKGCFDFSKFVEYKFDINDKTTW